MKKIKVCLIFIVNEDMINEYENLGICYIAAVLRQYGCEVLVKNYRINQTNYTEIMEFQPDIIGFSTYFNNINDVNKMANLIKKDNDQIVTFVGGPHVTLYAYEIMKKNQNIDFGIKGEGEYSTLEFIKHLYGDKKYHEVKGLLYRENDRIIENENAELIENIDELPFPARDLLEVGSQMALISTSRGCTANCAFCTHKKFWPSWRGRTASKVVDEIEAVKKMKDPFLYMIVDCSYEDPDINLERMKSLCREIIDRKVDILYSTSVRGNFFKKSTPEAEVLLKDSGLISVLIGIESGNQNDMKLYNKATVLEDNDKVLEYFEKLDILVIPSFINFNPYTTIEGLTENAAFLLKHNQCIRFFTFLDVFAYTPIYERLKEDHLIIEKMQDDGLYSFNYNMQDNSVYQYRFFNEDISKMVDYCKGIVSEINAKNNNAFNDLQFYFERHLLQMYALKRRAQNHQDNEMLQQLELHLEEYRGLETQFNQQLNKWIEEIIQLGKEGWDDSAARVITERNGLFELFSQMSIQFGHLRYRVMKRICKYDQQIFQSLNNNEEVL